MHLVKVHKHGCDALAAVRAERPARLGVWIDAIVVLYVALAVGIPGHLCIGPKRDGRAGNADFERVGKHRSERE